MSFLKRLFQKPEKASPNPTAEQAVLVYLDGSSLPDEVYEQNDLATIEDRIIAALAGKGLGEFDGNEIGPGGATLYLYGPEAERLFALIEPVLTAYPLCRNARVVIRKGGPGAPQREILLPEA
jgi:hypothetical protein